MSMAVAEGEEEEDAAEAEAGVEEDTVIVMIIVEGVVVAVVAVVEATCVILVDTIPVAHPGIHVVVAVVTGTLLEEAEDHPSQRLHLLHQRSCLLLQAVLKVKGKCLLKINSKIVQNPCVKSLWNFITRKNCFLLWMKSLVRPMLAKSLFKLI